ncbi:Dfp1/Him1, central region-domain-containing protein [Crucibulum laeve]|uniref:Dfp1/Him1, central region-domain-containing protein n=1 Tax=Crucibulum laeve TaxID=68775 RepID=A0A5C3MGP8_9AGAR|nr:Dfp1/Him1, central region-domain-containing protein [Crucibulum laeve]
MTTLQRRPLVNRPQTTTSVPAAINSSRSVSASFKRPRSPDHVEPSAPRPISKRPRSSVSSQVACATRDVGKERRHAEREQQNAEFKEKYTRAFPSWTFYFDSENIDTEDSTIYMLEKRIEHLGGRIEGFFSREVTHLITNQSLPSVNDASAEKENSSKAAASKGHQLLRSPIKLKGRLLDEGVTTPSNNLMSNAAAWGLKIWNITKLESVLLRCDSSLPSNVTSQPPAIANPQRSLSRLLQSEKIHGISERDPAQKRHDFRYFSRASRFVLVEDMRQELATIAAHEYPVVKGRDDTVNPPWPVLHCHPKARGPFVPFDDREKKRWEKQQLAEKALEQEQKTHKDRISKAELMRKVQVQRGASNVNDLRRSVSMSNLHRRASYPVDRAYESHIIDFDADCDNPDSAYASGYLASGTMGGYMAASGNSVSVTSTTGTTSTGNSLRSLHIPPALRLQRHVLTSLKAPPIGDKASCTSQSTTMGPPTVIPAKQSVLRKSKSTNTLKLPKREEGNKPGYCESCRQKFDNFKLHIASRKHRKYATDAANFLQLDCVLARVQRHSREEIANERKRRESSLMSRCHHMGRGMNQHRPIHNDVDMVII